VLQRAPARSELKATDAAPVRADSGKTGDFMKSLKVLGGRDQQLFDSSAEDLDGLSPQKKTQILSKEREARVKAQEALEAKAKAAAAAKAKPVHKPSLAQLRLDKKAAEEGDDLLAQDSKIAAEEMKLPETTVHSMISKDRRAVMVRQTQFEAHLKKMAATDKANEKRAYARESAQEKRVNGYVTSSDAAYESELAKAVKKETAGHNEYNKRFSSAEHDVVARDKSFSERLEAERRRQHARGTDVIMSDVIL